MIVEASWLDCILASPVRDDRPSAEVLTLVLKRGDPGEGIDRRLDAVDDLEAGTS